MSERIENARTALFGHNLARMGLSPHMFDRVATDHLRYGRNPARTLILITAYVEQRTRQGNSDDKSAMHTN
jgi:hypothetical protein